jgi:predicted permease
MGTDFRLAARLLRKSPLFALGVMALLAFGIASNTVAFSLVDALLLRELPVRDPGALVRFINVRPPLPPRGDFEPRDYEAWKQLKGVTGLIAWFERQSIVTDGQIASRARVDWVSANYFASLGAGPSLGRLFRPGSGPGDAEGGQPAVLSYPYWQRRFGGDVNVLGRKLEMDGHMLVVVGVSAKGFNGLTLETSPDIRVPLESLQAFRPDLLRDEFVNLEIAGRLAAGTSPNAARDEAQAVWRAASATAGRLDLHPASRGVSRLRGSYEGVLWMLLAGVALLLLIVCANAAGLLIARNAGREGELAVRTALGATRWRLVRQLLCESWLLLMGGVAGALALSYAGFPLVARSLPPVRDYGNALLTLSLDLEPNPRVAAFAIAISALTLALSGLLPALAAARRDPHGSLRQARAGGGGWRRRQFPIALQVALCTLLLAGAGLTWRTLRRLESLNPGFDASRVVSFTMDVEEAKYTAEQAEALRMRLLEGARALPDVDSASTSNIGLMRGSGRKMTVAPAGRTVGQDAFMNTSLLAVSPGYFETMGIRWLAGRNFTGREDPQRKPVPVVVNDAFRRRFGDVFAGRFGSAVVNGKPAGADFEVIGVVEDTKYRSLREPFQPIVYGLAGPSTSFILQVRTRTGGPDAVIPAMRRMLEEYDPRLSFAEAATLTSEIGITLWPERVAAGLAGVFAAVAAIVAGAGLYASMAFAVLQRQREIGIRMALGAAPGDVLRLFVTRAVWLSGMGILAGLACAWAVAPRIGAILYDVAPRDPLSLLGGAGLALAVMLLAAWAPSLRASRLDPSIMLRRD